MPNVQPVGNYLLVKIEEAKETTDSGIVLSEETQDKPCVAEVIAAGEDTNFTKGERVVFSKYGVTVIRIDGKDHSFLQDTDIIAVLEDTQAESE